MTIMPALLLLLCAAAQHPTIATLELTSEEPRQSGCLLKVQNSEEMLDLSTDCSLADAKGQWLELIPEGRAYLVREGQRAFKGYRYFKNQLHYSYQPELLAVFHNNLTIYLQTQQLSSLALPAEDRFTLTLQLSANSQWRVVSLHVHYLFSQVPQIAPIFGYTLIQTPLNLTAGPKDLAQRRLSGAGLHQLVNLTLELSAQTELQVDPLSCRVVISEVLPESSYIDPDQLRSVVRFESIDVEKPAHYSKQYYYSYTRELRDFKQVGVGKYNLQYPIHFRYPEPSNLNYTRVILHPSDTITLLCNGSSPISIQEDPFNNRGFANIFTGSSHDSKIVSMITFILMLLAAMVLAKQLRKDQ